MRVVLFFIAHEKGFELHIHAQPQIGAYSCFIMGIKVYTSRLFVLLIRKNNNPGGSRLQKAN